MCESNQPVENPSDFFRGQRHCQEGRPHLDGQSESYDRGYAAQYELDQVVDWRTSRGH